MLIPAPVSSHETLVQHPCLVREKNVLDPSTQLEQSILDTHHALEKPHYLIEATTPIEGVATWSIPHTHHSLHHTDWITRVSLVWPTDIEGLSNTDSAHTVPTLTSHSQRSFKKVILQYSARNKLNWYSKTPLQEKSLFLSGPSHKRGEAVHFTRCMSLSIEKEK